MLLVGGPTATEAKLEFVMRRKTGVRVPLIFSITLLVRSRKPELFTPLKMKLARPSHKLSKLKTALIIVGEFLGMARRTRLLKLSTPGVAVFQISARSEPLSTGLPGTTLRNFLKRTPCEAKMSFVSLDTLLISSKRVTPGPRGVSSVGLNQSLRGKSPAFAL